MEMKEARDKKIAVEAAICDLLKELEASTGLQVREVYLTRSGLVRGFALPPLSEIEIVCTI